MIRGRSAPGRRAAHRFALEEHQLGAAGQVVARLSAQSKLRAIRTLLGGRLSSDDLAAIRKICGAVRRSSEGNGIRAGVDLVAVSDLGQRTTLRVIFAQMP